MKKVIAIISLLLCMIVVVQSLPMSVYAEMLAGEAESVDSEQTLDSDVAVEEETEKIVYIISEDETQRDETTKVFRMSDGSYTAAVYPTQVHYEEDGEMKEIDNTLQSVDGDRFETKAGPVKISVPSSLRDEDAVEYSDGEHSVMFRLDTEKAAKGTRKAKEKKNKKIKELSEAIALQDMTDADFEKAYGKVKDESVYLDNVDSAIEEHNQLMMTSEKMGSQITYGSVFSDTDLRYTIMGTTLKEEIILKSSAGIQNKYEFVIGSETLTPVLMDDNSVHLCDSDGNKVFEINSPYMYDAEGEISEDIKVNLKKNSDGTYTYTLKPDKKWLEDDNRVYPIIIDPPISESNTYTVKDTTGYFASSATHDPSYIYIGQKNGTVEAQGMLYSPLPSVLSAGTTKIINARLALVGAGGTLSGGMQINAYRITTDWNTSNIDENSTLFLGSNGLSDYSDIIDYVDISTPVEGTYTWDITEAAEEWLNGETNNYGIALRANSVTANVNSCACFIDSTTSYNNTNSIYVNACPQFIYTYRDLRGIEDYWTFTSMSAGRFGTIGVNNYNGNPVITQPLVSSSGNNMPVSVSLIYSYNSRDNGKCGFGDWRTNYHMNIENCNHTFKIGDTVIATYKYCFIDSDGTRHYLKEEGSEHKDEDGLGLTMTLLDEYHHGYLLETKDKTKYKFDHYGRLNYIEDSNGNWNYIYFVDSQNSSKHIIDCIEEGNQMSTVKRITDFAYGEWNTDIISPDGEKATVAFTSNTKDKVFGFYYTDSNWETRVGATQIRWDSDNFPVAIYDGFGHRTYIESITSNGVKRVAAMSYGTSSEYLDLNLAEPAFNTSNTLQRYTFAYNTNYTTITDIDARAASYQFNNYGLTVSVVDHTTSWAQNYEYGVPNNQNKGYENKLTLASKTIAPAENRAVYPGFDEAASINHYYIYPSSIGIAKTYLDDRGNTDSGVMKLEKTIDSNTDTFIYQRVQDLEIGNYTLSIYVNTYGTTLEGNGVSAQVNVFNSSGYRNTFYSNAIKHTNSSWTRIQVTLEVLAGDTMLDIGVCLPADTYGVVFVDDIQIECNRSGGSLNDSLSGAGSFNLLENTTFATNATRYCWNGGAIVSNSRTADAPTVVRRYATFNNHPDYANYEKKIQQSVHISGNEGDIFIAGCWVKINSVPLDNNENKNTNVYATLFVKFYDEYDRLLKISYISCNTAVEDWQFLMRKIVAPANFEKVVYCFDYANNEGTAQIATPFLYKETYGQSYTYDGNGNLVSTEDAAELMATFAYQDDALTSSLSPLGSKYLYTRDDATNNIRYAFSNSGQKVEINYNESGDGTSMSIVDLPLLKNINETEMVPGCYIINAKAGHTLGVYSILTSSGAYVGLFNKDLCHQFDLYPEGNSTYSIRMHTDPTFSLFATDLGNDVEGFFLGMIPSNSTSPIESKFKLVSNDDGTFRILTETSNYEKCLRMEELKVRDNYYSVFADSAYDDDDLSKKWYIYTFGTEQKITTSATYTDDGNYLLSSTDQAGNTVNYSYDFAKGLLTQTTDPKGNSTTYTYDNMRRTTGVSSALNTVSYTYVEDQLSEISVGNDDVVYGFTYDQYGRNTSVSVGNGTNSQTLATYEFTGQEMTKQTYGNGVFVNFTYDSVDRLNKKWYNNDTNYVEYLYNPNGYLYRVTDGYAGTSTYYEYDLAGRNVATFVRGSTIYDPIAEGSVTYADVTGLVTGRTTIVYNSDGEVANHLNYSYFYAGATSSAGAGSIGRLQVNNERIDYEYDVLGRLVKKKSTIGSDCEDDRYPAQMETGKNEQYTYVNNTNGTTTTLIKTFRDMLGVLHTYEYDANGNITSEIIGEGSNTESKTYYYDSHNRLIRYNDSELYITIIYTYDSRGNILNYTVYDYAAGNGSVDESTAYAYDYAYNNSTWKDLVTTIMGENITYDGIGNPTNWFGHRYFTWQNGRQLARVNTDGRSTVEYTYNGDGLRTGKTNARNTQYIILDGTYLGERTTINGTEYLIVYLYGAEGDVMGLIVNGTSYYFIKNLQGDVTAIIDVNGNVLANYTYDAYGYIMGITDANGASITSTTHIANLNPFRYRGYFYDQETGFYYLRSRYYDPEVGRFLNADGMVSTGVGLDGYNMFAYCNDNPIMFVDFTGDCANENGHIDCTTITICNISHSVLKQQIAVGEKCGACGLFHCGKYALTHIVKSTHYPVDSSVMPSTYSGHDALDFGASEGSNVFSYNAGRIKKVVDCYDNSFRTNSEDTPSWGNYVIIEGIDGKHYLYAHLQQGIPWDVDDWIYAGDVIGSVGSTGRTLRKEGGVWVLGWAHLHFEIQTDSEKIPQNDYPWKVGA